MAQDVNGALRRAYESAVDETIPQSMMDLLNKLN
ncbi:NepR family anti-sigma factor [Sphingopyxis sp.]